MMGPPLLCVQCGFGISEVEPTLSVRFRFSIILLNVVKLALNPRTANLT